MQNDSHEVWTQRYYIIFVFLLTFSSVFGWFSLYLEASQLMDVVMSLLFTEKKILKKKLIQVNVYNE